MPAGSEDLAARFCGVGVIDNDFDRNADTGMVTVEDLSSEVPTDLTNIPRGVGESAIVGGMVTGSVVA